MTYSRRVRPDHADWKHRDVKRRWSHNFTAFDQWRNENFNEMVSAIPEAKKNQIVWNAEVEDSQIVSSYKEMH